MSHLPLLFADGQPTCLQTITQAQLERFIPFMLQCCPRTKRNPPQWWPKEIPFYFPLKPTPPVQKHWVTLLKTIVRQCYDFYESTYILTFCTKLAALGNKRLEYRENGNRIDIIERNSRKLLVSVNSKNKIYDQPSASPYKSLLPRPLPGLPVYESPPVLDDIYLCSYCDAEFTCCKDACEHEKTAHAPQVEELTTPQENFFKALGLVVNSKLPADDSKPRRITSNLTLKKCHSIPLCTPLGSLLLASTPSIKPQDIAKTQEKVDQHCCTDDIVTSESNGIRRSRRVPGGSLGRFRQCWSHSYSFNKKQRAERMETIRTGLDRNSRRLLRLCRRAKTTVRRLPPLPRNTTIDLRRLKEFIAEEYPKQIILEAHKPRPVAVIPPPQPQPLANILTRINPIPHMYAAFNKRPPLAGVPTNQMPTKRISANGIITKMVSFQPIHKKAVSPPKVMPTLPRPVIKEDPVVIDLCSSDEECEVVVIPNKTKEAYPPLGNTPKYGVTAASPKENCPKVTETELAGIPATVMYVKQFCRTRS